MKDPGELPEYVRTVDTEVARKHVASSLFEQGDFPLAGRSIVPQDVQATVATTNLEVAVVSARPTIEYLSDLDTTVADAEREGHLIASVAWVAFDPHRHRPVHRVFPTGTR
ncbi:MAG TPA: hypothetical protein VKP13_04465 [Nitrospira sp.]|nr:hypothetical protein [Nitrospira sp.]